MRRSQLEAGKRDRGQRTQLCRLDVGRLGDFLRRKRLLSLGSSLTKRLDDVTLDGDP